MSFSAKVKKELCGHENKARHCDIAEIAGIINTCGVVSRIQGRCVVRIQTENPVVAKAYFKLLKKTFACRCDISIKHAPQLKKNRVYNVATGDSLAAEKMLLATGIMTRHDNALSYAGRINPTIIKSDCCKRAYLRGAFISGGSLADPEKSYHLEFINANKGLAQSLLDSVNFFKLNAKMIVRKGYYVVYLKEGENIVDLLNMMSAHVSLMDLENVRVMKHVRNNVNRVVNFETANLNKTVDAAVRQTEDIKYIFETKGTDYLAKQLLDVALIRLSHPEASLTEIGAMLTPKVGKSGVNHRLRKIGLIADYLRGGHYD